MEPTGTYDQKKTEEDLREYDDNTCEQEEYFYLKEKLETYIQEAEQSLKIKSFLLERNNNAVPQRPTASDIAKRDQSVKKNSGFIKKLRNLGASQIDSLIKESLTLNLSKYLSEAASAIVEARIKFTDIPSALLLCTELNCTYQEFTGLLQEEFIKILSINKDEPVVNANRLRVELCFYAELSLCGVISARRSLPVLGTTLVALTADKNFNTLNVVLSFCKHCGPEFAGLVPRHIRLLCEQFSETLKSSSTLLASSKQESVRHLLLDYYQSLCQHLKKKLLKLSAYEKQSRQILKAKGDLHPERIAHAELIRTEVQTLLSGTVTFSETLDVELPDLPDIDLQDFLLGDVEDCSGGRLWDDEETNMFYTQLPDVKEYLGQLNDQEDNKEKRTEKFSEIFQTDEPEIQSKIPALDTFLKLLPDCLSKSMIDNAALEFLIYFNSKASRRKLIITLFTVPRNKLKLLPFYARFVAIVDPVVPEIASTLRQQLKSEMQRHIHKKDQVNMESKRKTVKFIGELVNFKIYSKKEALCALKMLFYDFTHHNIEMACSLLETCGKVLYSTSDTHLSTKYYLEQMLRLKTMMTLDSHYVTLIENTYYHILPPEPTSDPSVVQLTIMQQFIAKSVYQDLMQYGSDTAVLNILRSLNWDCDETASYTIKCLTNVFNISYLRIRSLASVMSQLADYQEDAVCRVVDGVLEDIRLGMEVNRSSFNQRRVATVKYLGELYNYRLLETSDILRVLYSLILFGVAPEQDLISDIDPPSSVTRIHLVLLLLSTCVFPLFGMDTSNKLKYFIIYFQQYYWIKRSHPIWTEENMFPTDLIYRFEDVLNSLYPDFTLAKNLEEALNNANNLNIKIYSDATLDSSNIHSSLNVVYEENDEDSPDEESNTIANEDLSVMESTLQINCQETEESDRYFLQELNQMISESIKMAESNTVKPNIDIAVPLNYKKAITDNEQQFVLLLKKGSKQAYKPLTLPAEHELVLNLKSRKEETKQEKEKFKRLTLDINERIQDDIQVNLKNQLSNFIKY